jgi:hypothetical protein
LPLIVLYNDPSFFPSSTFFCRLQAGVFLQNQCLSLLPASQSPPRWCRRATLELAKSVRDVKLNGYVMFPTELLCLRSRVAPYQVSTFVSLKVPWRNQDNISFPYPYASLHFAADATQTFMSVLTLNKNTVETKQFDGYT